MMQCLWFACPIHRSQVPGISTFLIWCCMQSLPLQVVPPPLSAPPRHHGCTSPICMHGPPPPPRALCHNTPCPVLFLALSRPMQCTALSFRVVLACDSLYGRNLAGSPTSPAFCPKLTGSLCSPSLALVTLLLLTHTPPFLPLPRPPSLVPSPPPGGALDPNLLPSAAAATAVF